MDLTRDRRQGIALVAASALFWSTAGPCVRMAHMDTWSLVFWRSVFSFLVIGAIALFMNGHDTGARIGRIGMPGVASLGLSVVSMIAYVVTLQLTSVANVMITYATLPFITTGLAWVWVGETVTRRFLVAGAVALVGIAVTAGAVTTSHDVLGMAVALIMTAGFGGQLVLMKRHRSLDMTLLITLAAALCVPIAAPFTRPTIPAFTQLLACAFFGVLTTGLAYLLALKGGRLISSGEAALISMLDVVLGPLWVWMFFAETPSLTTVAGGSVVLAAVLWYLWTAPSGDDPSITPEGQT